MVGLRIFLLSTLLLDLFDIRDLINNFSYHGLFWVAFVVITWISLYFNVYKVALRAKTSELERRSRPD